MRLVLVGESCRYKSEVSETTFWRGVGDGGGKCSPLANSHYCYPPVPREKWMKTCHSGSARAWRQLPGCLDTSSGGGWTVSPAPATTLGSRSRYRTHTPRQSCEAGFRKSILRRTQDMLRLIDHLEQNIIYPPTKWPRSLQISILWKWGLPPHHV